MSYNGGLKAHSLKVRTKYRRVFVGVCTEVERSIKEGSEITGAPGQPRATSNLYFSWIGRFVSPFKWIFGTSTTTYAKPVEDNVRGVRFRNHGSHSVSLTLFGADRILREVTRRENV